MTKTGVVRSAPLVRRGPPEISMEWVDVTIDIRVCGLELPPEERGYLSLYPRLDEKLISSEVIDLRRAQQRERKRMPGYKYETIPVEEEEEDGVGRDPAPKAANYKVLPKLTCRHCGKTFSRKSTLDQHLVSHSSERWADVQDAAIKDLEQAIAFSGEPQFAEGRRAPQGEEEQEISPPPDVKEEAKEGEEKEEAAEADRHQCSRCNKQFSRLSLLNRHMKLHSGVKPFACDVCGWRFLQRYNLKKHMITHSQNKPHKCGECDATFSDAALLRNHLMKQHSQGPSAGEQGRSAGEAVEEQGVQGVDGMVPCPKCDRTFAAKAHLERHMPVHTTMVKPYSCVVCGWRFHLLHNMQRHLATHKTQDKVKKGSKEATEDGTEAKDAVEEMKE